MTKTKLSAIALAFTTVFATQAMAADNGQVTRAEVKAELAEAIQNGQMVINESGVPMYKVFPHNYPQQNTSTVTREQVRAELAEARHAGNVVVSESGKTAREIMPHNYGGPDNVATKSREEVRTELAEAYAYGWMDRHIEA